MRKRWWFVPLMAVSLAFACGDCDDDEQGENNLGTDTGNSCLVPDDCYPDVERDDIRGTVMCLDRVEDGYCTHGCTTDSDCCAAEGECEQDIDQVCGPFESTGQMMCFLSCEGKPDDYCQTELSEEFGCRSTGGGSDNRKVCVPGG